EEAVAGSCCLEAFLQGPVVGGCLTETLLERGFLGSDTLKADARAFVFEVPDLSEELADVGALVTDLGTGGFERVLGVEGAFAPRRLGLRVGIGQVAGPLVGGFSYGVGDQGMGNGVLIEEGA